MSHPSPGRPEVFTSLREQLFHGDLLALTGGAPGEAAPGTEPEVIGVAMEIGFDTGTCLVFGLRDGSASVYLSSGGGSIGGQTRPHINAAAKRLVERARPLLGRLPKVAEYPLPADGRVRFSLFTTAGVHASEADERDLMREEGELFPLFAAAHEIITGFRQIEAPEPKNEPAYVNCLLTTLARGHARSVTLRKGTPPPDPTHLTADAEDLQWIAKIGFALDRLSTQAIIALLLKEAGFRWFQVGKAIGHIQVKLADHGESFSDVVFRVQRRRRQGRIEVEIDVEHRERT
jgi:hypothetical protein